MGWNLDLLNYNRLDHGFSFRLNHFIERRLDFHCWSNLESVDWRFGFWLFGSFNNLFCWSDCFGFSDWLLDDWRWLWGCFNGDDWLLWRGFSYGWLNDDWLGRGDFDCGFGYDLLDFGLGDIGAVSAGAASITGVSTGTVSTGTSTGAASMGAASTAGAVSTGVSTGTSTGMVSMTGVSTGAVSMGYSFDWGGF